ncbi:hypothetical protein OIDMADRAFT_43200 [Oidiodendron maius Zn]|uniref:Ketoreductase (KR) domain-containing protein n=1 Tax=Oidiodendron maius (strain Zn) TaxID=913774 RepID=A0A0C3HA29_OIDMZ|nr:hypothetical protein OIDMADRAFT_43200 [Oidiodendron maius Zn]
MKIVRDQNMDGKLTGKVFFITGCTSGLGLETARAIHATGADIYFTGRDAQKGKEIREALLRDGKPGKAEYVEMHLDSLGSVRAAATEFLRSDKLNVLICSAGVRCCLKGKTKDGFELHFRIKHLGHFALFQALKDILIASSTASFHSRFISLSASGHRQSGIRFDDIHFDKIEKNTSLFLAMRSLHGLAVHPGGITGTSLNCLTPADQITALVAIPDAAICLKSAEQGAATTVWAAIAKELEGKGKDTQRIVRKAASRPWEESLRMISPDTKGEANVS